jgi:peptidoglycan hydrolase CwlO-like protein
LSYAEVRLTDEEANELMNEIQESKKELNQVKTELTEAQKELSDVKNTYSEQKTYYEGQLTEAEEREKVATYLAVGGMTASIVLTGVLLILIFL